MEIAAGTIERKIFLIRGKRVMLDRDLAQLYGVTTGNLNKAVNRNPHRFPGDFMFRLTKKEFKSLRFHSGISNSGSHVAASSRGGRRFLPYVFTEQGVAMLSSVLNSERAIMVNIQIMRAFIQLKRMLLSKADLKRRIDEMEKKYDKQFAIVFQALRRLLEPPAKEQRVIRGFRGE